ncbi:MAG TPA: hypothetical protein VN114_11005 [Oxalicibacterium sp.]|uniref:hypothetical protein n=1 Tax=Oxalicibacterium sp. TaxID=2766525 RepID=UPI002C25BCA2|nr:hypothetical protein [Oxalicibacterium sp.]HWU99032.1 hypothetical protein [Oxalicibacterium sp.]
MDDDVDDRMEEPTERPWIVLKNTYDVEMWIEHQSRQIQQRIGNAERNRASGYGICFRLTAGGDIFMHTTGEGIVLLDVTPEAEWIAPLIVAATQASVPAGQIWMLPMESLTQLVVGLSSLIASTRIVTDHDFRIRKY